MTGSHLRLGGNDRESFPPRKGMTGESLSGGVIRECDIGAAYLIQNSVRKFTTQGSSK